MATVKVGVSGLNPGKLLAKAILIHGKLTGNVNFLNPIPDLVTFFAAITSLGNAITAASNFDRSLIIARNLRADELRLFIKQLAAYVQSVSNGDADMIISSGFEIRQKPGPKVQMTQVKNLVAAATLAEGEIYLSRDPVKAAKTYELDIKDLGFTGDGGTAGTPGTPTPGIGSGEWKHLESVTSSRFKAINLISGHIYQFRVRALGASGHGAHSDIAQVRAK